MSFAPSRTVKGKYNYIGQKAGDWHVFEENTSKGKFNSKKKAKEYLDSL